MVIRLAVMESSYSRYRWVILTSYMLVAALTQLLWLNFAPITSTVQSLFRVSEMDVGFLSTVFPLLFILFSIPAGLIADRKGFKAAVSIGAFFTGLFAFLRAFSWSFAVLLLFQCGVAIGQPFIFNSISKLVNEWFPPRERALATGLGTMALFIGMMVALSLTPVLTEDFGFNGMLLIYGITSVLFSSVFPFIAKRNPYYSLKEQTREKHALKDISLLFKSRNLVLLDALFFIGVGLFTSFATWIEKILTPQGLTVTEAGLAGGTIIFGGIIGSIVIPALSDKFMKRKPFLLIDLAVATISLFTIINVRGYVSVSLVAFALGFFLMSALPLGLELAAEAVDQSLIGSATGLLWLFSQLGSVVLIVAAESIKAVFGGFRYSVFSFTLLCFLAFILSSMLREK